jgi:hypothetical protein
VRANPYRSRRCRETPGVLRVCGQLELAHPMGLPAVRAPDAPHGADIVTILAIASAVQCVVALEGGRITRSTIVHQMIAFGWTRLTRFTSMAMPFADSHPIRSWGSLSPASNIKFCPLRSPL